MDINFQIIMNDCKQNFIQACLLRKKKELYTSTCIKLNLHFKRYIWIDEFQIDEA